MRSEITFTFEPRVTKGYLVVPFFRHLAIRRCANQDGPAFNRRYEANLFPRFNQAASAAKQELKIAPIVIKHRRDGAVSNPASCSLFTCTTQGSPSQTKEQPPAERRGAFTTHKMSRRKHERPRTLSIRCWSDKRQTALPHFMVVDTAAKEKIPQRKKQHTEWRRAFKKKKPPQPQIKTSSSS